MEGGGCTSWHESYDCLTDKEKTQFSLVINTLAKETYVLRHVYDSRSKGLAYNPDYGFILQYHQLLRDYLMVIGWDIQVNQQYGLVALINIEGKNYITLDKNTTYFLYLLRYIYNEKRDDFFTQQLIRITIAELIEKGMATNLMGSRPSMSSVAASLKKLRSFNVLTKVQGNWDSPETVLMVYPTILFIVTDEKISSVYKMLAE
ncbi:MAG: DUF4194 domain-containing protein [Syntrophomonas sp.]